MSATVRVPAPYLPRVSNPLNVGDRRYLLDLAGEIFAAVLIVVGILGLAWVGFETDWRLGVAVISVALIAFGITLGTDRR